MRLTNLTKNTILAEEIALADQPLARIKGLLGRREFKQGCGLLIKPCKSVHTFFMHFPIDLLFVDKRYKVIKALPRLLPYKLSGIYLRACAAIELPCGTLQSSQTSEGDILQLQ